MARSLDACGDSECKDSAADAAGAVPPQKLTIGRTPPASSVAAWLTSRIFVRERLAIVEPGRLFFAGVPRGVDHGTKTFTTCFNQCSPTMARKTIANAPVSCIQYAPLFGIVVSKEWTTAVA
mmetsp:Transcript_127737/g.249003  ORF Transcript_127737/g.249003 Transcript_127737/m.249003 type:complete len:122 (-) Transcript_127737:340-705(-)